MPSLNDLRRLFFGGLNGQSISDAEYDVLSDLVGDGGLGLNQLQIAAKGLSTEGALFVLDSGQSTIPRRDCITNGIVRTSGTIRFTSFVAAKSFTATSLRLVCAGAAAATPTLVRAGIYSVAANGDMTLIASIANDTTLFAVANTEYVRALTAPVAIAQGARYAVGEIVVSAGAPSNGVGDTDAHTASVAMNKRLPHTVVLLTGQTDLVTPVTYASVVGAGGGFGSMYAEVLP